MSTDQEIFDQAAETMIGVFERNPEGQAAICRAFFTMLRGQQAARDGLPSVSEQIVAQLGDDAATLRQSNPDDQIATTMDQAATMITQLDVEAQEFTKAWGEAQQRAMPYWLGYEADSNGGTLTIHGKRFSAALFGDGGFLAPPGTWLRIEAGAPDLVTVTKLHPLELNEHTRAILGRPNFTCIHIAQRLRQMGFTVATHSEDEQASTLYFLLSLYLQHGDRWAAVAEQALRGQPPAETSAPAPTAPIQPPSPT